MTNKSGSILEHAQGCPFVIDVHYFDNDGCRSKSGQKSGVKSQIIGNTLSSPDSDLLKVAFGQRTFNAEGQETPGRYFSRSISWPRWGNSGVTIGRGYDMGQRTAPQIIKELTASGLGEAEAAFLSLAAKQRGAHAGAFVAKYGPLAPVISLEVQKKLFENITTPEIINDIKRIFSKADTVKAYGEASWDNLSVAAKELIFDLRYRGDYTPTTRKVLQPLIVNRDYNGLKMVMNDTEYWKGLRVPPARISERQELAREL